MFTLQPYSPESPLRRSTMVRDTSPSRAQPSSRNRPDSVGVALRGWVPRMEFEHPKLGALPRTQQVRSGPVRSVS